MAERTRRGGGIETPAGPKGFQALPSGLWTPQQTGAVAGNLVGAYQRAPKESLKLGKSFYPNWNEDAHHIGEAIGQTHEHGAAILAQLSPSNEAEQNRIHALQLVHGMDDKATAHMLKAGESAGLAKGAGVRARHAEGIGDSAGASHWTSEHAKHTADNLMHRSKAGITGTPLGSLGSTFIAKALQVKAGVPDPLSTLGNVKIGDFGHLIANPKAERAPIDTHYHDAALNRTDIPYATSRGLSSVGRYENFQNAHSVARGEVSEGIGRKISSGEMMGGIWYAHQQRKVEENPSALQARKATDTKLGRIRASKAAQPFLPERFGLRPSLGKIKTG